MRYPQATAAEIIETCLDLQFPSFDTLGREESSLPHNISHEARSFILLELPLSAIAGLDDPWVEIDGDKLDHFTYRYRLNPVGARNVPPPVLDRELEPIDGWHRSIALRDAGIRYHEFWVPLRFSTLLRARRAQLADRRLAGLSA